MTQKPIVLAPFVLAVATLASPAGAQHDSYATEAAESSKVGHLSKLRPLRAAGIDATIWAWLTYSRASEGDPKYSWGAELELDLSKTIANRVTLATDIEFIAHFNPLPRPP